MNKVYLWLTALILSSWTSLEVLSHEKAVSPTTSIPHNHPLSSLCGDLGKSLAHINDEKAKSIITAFCTLYRHKKVSYIDKMQLTINIQGDDVTYSENYKNKDNKGTKNKQSPAKGNHSDPAKEKEREIAHLKQMEKWKKAQEIQDEIDKLMGEINELSHQFDQMVKNGISETDFNAIKAKTDQKIDKLQVLMKSLEEEIRKIS